MKFIISENKFNTLIENFIDNYIRTTYDRTQFDNFIVYSAGETEFGFDDVKIEFDSEDGRLYLDKDFVMTIMNLFGLTPLESQIKIHEWFEDYEGISANYVDTPGIGLHEFDESK
jgi:hypothetical protein